MADPLGDHPEPLTVVDVEPRSFLVLATVALGALGVLAILQAAPSMLTKVVVGVVLALALDPVVVRVRDRLRTRRGAAVGIVGVGLALLFFAVLAVLGPAAIDEAGNLRRDLPATVEQSYTWPVVGDRLAEADAADRVADAIDRLPAELDDRQLTRFAEGVLGGAFTAVVVLVTAIAVMMDGDRLIARVRGVVDDDRRARLDAVGRVVYRTFGNYFAGSILVAILNGLVILTVALVLGIPLAPLAGLWSTLTNLIPQIGGFLGGSFLILLALTEGPVTAAIALVVFFGYQSFENNVIQPAVVGKAVRLTPPTTMLAALIGGAIAGVPGALVATPIVGAAKVLYLRDAADGSVDGEGIEDEPVEEPARSLRARLGGIRPGGRRPGPPTA